MISCRRGTRLRFSGHGILPVSYTHLEDQRDKAIKKAKDEAKRIVENARRESEAMIAELRAMKKAGGAQEHLSLIHICMMPNSAGSQFFIMVEDAPHLDGQYAAFGKVTEGMQTADEIVSVPRNAMDKPKVAQRMKSVRVDTHGVNYVAEKIRGRG